jgi:hypothetical protein
MPVQGTVKTIVPLCWRWLGNCWLRPQATVLKSSPAPRVNGFDCSLGAGDDLGTLAFGLAPVLKSSPAPLVNSFDCSLNRQEITVYCLRCNSAFIVIIYPNKCVDLPSILYYQAFIDVHLLHKKSTLVLIYNPKSDDNLWNTMYHLEI